MTIVDTTTDSAATGTAETAECGCAIVSVVFIEDHYRNQYNIPADSWAATFEHTKTYLGAALFDGGTVTVRGNVDDGSFRVFDGSEVTNEQHWRTEEIPDCDRHEPSCNCSCCFDWDGYPTDGT